jgi:hypothetical protein
MIANIASDDALILPHRANPAGLNFRERQASEGWAASPTETGSRAVPCVALAETLCNSLDLYSAFSSFIAPFFLDLQRHVDHSPDCFRQRWLSVVVIQTLPTIGNRVSTTGPQARSFSMPAAGRTPDS